MSKKPEKRMHKLVPLVLIAVLALTAAAVALWILRPPWLDNILPKPSVPEMDGVVVPWNPGGTADLVARSLLNESAPDLSIQNVHGANGAAGLNEVYGAVRDGKRLLSTNLSSLVTLRQMGFTETGHGDWAVWLAAYSPSIIAVGGDSPYQTLGELIAAARRTELRCANAGNGTLGSTAANLFVDGVGISVMYVAYSGSNPAINAVANGEADFIAALSSELLDKLRSGELRALAVLSDNAVVLNGAVLPPASDTVPELTNIEPFGEYYGFMIPADTPESIQKGYDRQWSEAVASDAFGAFAEDKGLLRLDTSRERGKETAGRIASLVCWTLYDTGCVNVSPETLGVERGEQH